jgi:RNA polymerase-binding transcription factor DksA
MSSVPPFGPSQLMLEAPKFPLLALTYGSVEERPRDLQPPVSEPDQSSPEESPGLGDAQLLEQMSAELDAVEAALARLDRGSFDTCELCGGRIGQDRLLEDPLLTRCPSHG